MWPAGRENRRLLAWMMRRLSEADRGECGSSGLLGMGGLLPTPGTLDLTGLPSAYEPLIEENWVDIVQDSQSAAGAFFAFAPSHSPPSAAPSKRTVETYPLGFLAPRAAHGRPAKDDLDLLID